MNRNIKIAGFALLLGALSGCQTAVAAGTAAAQSSQMASAETENFSISLEETSGTNEPKETLTEETGNKETGNEGSSQTPEMSTQLPSKDSLARKIQEQSFDVTLDGWGSVTFASFLPEENENHDGDVSFKLLKGNEIVYEFPGMTEDNRRPYQTFHQVAAVSFKDYNSDGKTDIILIIEYAPQHHPEESYNEVRLYTQSGDDADFLRDDPLLTEYLSKNHYNSNVRAVLDGIAEYQNYQKAMQQPESSAAPKQNTEKPENPEEQLQLLADSIDTWHDGAQGQFGYSSNPVFYTVTDLDQNGRLELIVSCCQGTGFYTYSFFFEVTPSLDGLQLCDRTLTEGDSEADITFTDSPPVYYDASTHVYYYVFDDLIRNGAAERYENKRAIALIDSTIHETYLAQKSTIFSGSATAPTVTCFSTLKNAGQKTISEAAYERIADTAFSDLTKQKATISWYKEDSKNSLLDLTQEELLSALTDLYHGFSVE